MSIKLTKNGDYLIPKDKDVSESAYDSAAYGTEYTIVTPFESNIQIIHGNNNNGGNYNSLKNIFNYYKTSSPEFDFNSYKTSTTCFIKIPSVFYGSEIRKGSVEINYYVTGTLVGQLTDANKRGELRQTIPSGVNAGKVAGVCMYKHGIVLLTGSWNVGTNEEDYDDNEGVEIFQWRYFNKDASATLSSSYDLKFEGTTYTPSMMIYAYADKGELNHSNNPTAYSTQSYQTSSNQFVENAASYVNTIKSDFTNTSESFEKQTFIDSIGLYDENKNLIAVAKLAKPIRKSEEREFAFKLKLDL